MTRYHDQPQRLAAGILLQAENTGRVLLGLRSALVRRPRLWGVFGGGVEPEEDLLSAAVRELKEEAKVRPQAIWPWPIYSDGAFYAFHGTVPYEVRPILNWESEAAGWFDLDDLPANLHPGTAELVGLVM